MGNGGMVPGHTDDARLKSPRNNNMRRADRGNSVATEKRTAINRSSGREQVTETRACT